MSNMRNLDLNLLITLDALLKYSNVTRTAKQLNLSQPTVSVHLAKLRTYFQDPLFLPCTGGMRPTARAELIKVELSEALEKLNNVISPPSLFEPKNSTHTWRIIASDYSEVSILMPIINRLRQEAPNTKLAILDNANYKITQQQFEKSNKIDFIFHTREESPPWMRYRTLFTERYVLTSRINHPKLKSTPTLKQFLSLDFVIVSPDGGGFWGDADKILSGMDLNRNVMLSVQHFMFAISTIITTDFVALLPLRIVKGNPKLQYFTPPIDIPSFDINVLWYEHMHLEPAHKWLRHLIIESLGGINEQYSKTVTKFY